MMVIRFVMLLLALTAVSAGAAEMDALSLGERIYRDGILPDNRPLRGERQMGASVAGSGAACVNCHRRSGLGSVEGNIIVPPITARYLYRPRGGRLEDVDLQYAQVQISLNREAYSDATLARAIGEGIGRDGRPLNILMPRFDLDSASMSALVTYLKSLGNAPVPGVTEDTLHFATVITPDADPVARRGMLDVMQRFFADKNEFIRGGKRPLQGNKEISFRVSRRWQLHVWELEGPPDSWEQQLIAHQREEPVFAIVSGLAGKTWAPVHHFCEAQGIPCLFPNTDLPVVAENDFYPLYFSRGVLLEADLVADAALEVRRADPAVGRIIQVFRPDDIGAAAAAALAARVRRAGLENVERPLAAGPASRELTRIIGEVDRQDLLVLWLRPPDLALLPALPAKARQIVVSGLLGGMEDAPLPAAWRRVVHMTYPVDLPESRKFRTDFPHAWFQIRHIPMVADRVQSDTYLACGILAETLVGMLDSFVPEYLVESIENMLSRRTLSGFYPRLGLAPHQRFASKGGYLVSFPSSEVAKPLAEGGWRVP